MNVKFPYVPFGTVTSFVGSVIAYGFSSSSTFSVLPSASSFATVHPINSNPSLFGLLISKSSYSALYPSGFIGITAFDVVGSSSFELYDIW